MANWDKHKELFLAFFRVGVLGYGGGPSSIPLVHVEAVRKYQWMTTEEFTDILAIGNTLPGPIATKMAGYIGHSIAGILGAINAVLATIMPSIILMIVLLTSLAAVKDQPWVQGMSRGVIPVVAVLLGSLTWEFIDKAKSQIGWTQVLGIFVLSLVILEGLGLHPGLWIAAAILYALVKPLKEEEKEKETDR